MDGNSPTAAIAVAAPALSGADPAAARKQLALLYQHLPVDDRRYVSEADRDEIFRRLRKENRISTEMDKIYPEQLFRMELGGNRRAHEFLREHGADLSQPLDYHGKLAAKHRQMLDRLVSTEMQGIGWVVGSQSDPAAQTTGTAAQHNQHQQLPQQQQQQTYGGLRSNDERVQLHDQPLSTPTTALAANSVNAPVPVAVPAAPAGPARGHIVESSWGGVAKPAVSGRGVRSRKLEMDFDFEKEAALLAAKQRAAAQGSSHVSGSSSQPPAQQQATGLVSVSGNNGSSNIHRAATNPTFGSSGCTSLGSGAAGAAGYGSSGSATSAGRGSNSTRFSGAKSISSAQYFNQEDSSPPVAPVPVDPSRRAIGSDEVFGRSNTGRRGWEDQSAARVEALRMHAQQGWQQLSQAGSDALSKAREWLAGT